MLRSDPAALQGGFVLDIISAMHGGGRPREIQEGVVEVSHFGSSDFLPGYDHWPELATVHSYGVCDTLPQLLDVAREEVVEGPRIFLVTVTIVRRADQPEEGGWRWKKWGPYLGNPTNQRHEYLYEETHLEALICYHIFEKK